MHASLQQQQGPYSPKLPNSSPATSPQKHSPDSVQNSSSNLFSKRKGKKRDRGDQSPEPIRRELCARLDSGLVNSESSLNVEISKFAERGLVDSEAVAGLVRLMQPTSPQRKIDLARRSMLVGIIATTDNRDYLTQFIQLKGLAILDEWLQEVHKGKVGDRGNVKDSDKSVENFLLVLLRALVKLPVNLNALQMCNIGKSVNYLRSHKNSEIQKKAKSLVDTWKKRVEAEMSVNDERPGYGRAVPSSCRAKDDSHGVGGYRHSGGSHEAATRNSVTRHSSLKSSPAKLAHEGSNLKSGSAFQSNGRPAFSHISTVPDCKNGQSRISVDCGGSVSPQTVAREERSSGSSQSHTNSQCSSDHAKYLVPCGKADAKRFTCGSKSLNKITAKDSKHRRLVKGHTAGLVKETASHKSSLIDQVSHNPTDVLVHVGDVHEGNNHELSINIVNRVEGPAQSTVVASADGFSCRSSIASSPVVSEMHGKSDACLNGKHDSHQADGVVGSLAVELQKSIDASRSPTVTKDVYSTVGNEMNLRKPHCSFRSIDALIETCIRLSEVVVSMSDGDDFGVNLLASVATGDFSNSGMVSPSISPLKPSATDGISSIRYIGNEKQAHVDGLIPLEYVSDDVRTDDCDIDSSVSKVNDGEPSHDLGNANEGLHQKEEGCLGDNRMSDEQVAIPCTTGRSEADINDNGGSVKDECCHLLPFIESVASHVKAEDKLKDSSPNDKSENATHRDTTYSSINDDYAVKMNVYVEPGCNSPMEHISPVLLQSESRNADEVPAISSRTSQNMVAVNATINVGKTVSVELCNRVDEEGKRMIVLGNDLSQVHEKQEDPRVHRADMGMGTGCKDEHVDNKEAFVCSSAGILPIDLHSSTNEGEYRGNTMEDSGVTSLDAASLPATRGSDADAKHGFDLNEGLNDEGKHKDPVKVNAGPCLTSITVTAAVKEHPSDDLLRSKKELEWKGLKSTSIFHSAKSREVMELPLCPSEVAYPDGAACRQSRPPLDIDLNVADESSGQESDFRPDSVCELMTTTSLRSSGCLEFDLNEVDEASDIVQQPVSNRRRDEASRPSIPSVKQLPSSNFVNGKASNKRDFDLNDGPAMEEVPVEQTSYSQPFCNNMSLQSSFGPRISPSDAGNFSVWNPHGTNYSVSVPPSTLPDREAFPIAGISGGLHHIIGGPASSLSFYPDAYRGSVVASSLAMPFQSAPYQYPIFPFGTGCSRPTSAFAGGPSGYIDPAAGGRFSAIPSQLVGNAAAVSFQYPHAYGVQRPIQDVNSGVFDSNQRWGKLGLDLNSGPGAIDLEWRNGLIPTVSVSRQVSAINLRPLVKDQARMFSMGGGILKRKEPDGGWNVENG
ncbi:hypothetical protein RND81_02G025400 [Saponaria officinalis]